jgi:hypothetical protein
MERWYVYYKVASTDTTAVAQCVREMFNVLGSAVAQTRLMRRAENEGDDVTLMEVYEPVTDARAFAAALEGAVRASGFPPALATRRRIERFKDL